MQWFDYAFIPKSVLWLSLRSNLIEELANYYEMRSGFHLTFLVWIFIWPNVENKLLIFSGFIPGCWA